MAKGLRSKVKRAFRTIRRATLAETVEQKASEDKRQDVMNRILEQGRAAQAARDMERSEKETAEPQAMDTAAAAAAAAVEQAAAADAMDTDGRLKANKKLGKGKRMKKVKIGLSGANQFYKLTKKGKKRSKKNNPGYTIATSY